MALRSGLAKVLFLAGSVGLHGSLVAWAGRATPELGAPRARATGGMVEAARKTADAAARRELASAQRPMILAAARSLRAKGALPLGEVILRANAVDAFEAGGDPELSVALELYGLRVKRLREALGRSSVPDAVAEVFADVQYVGRPGGRMLDAVLTGRGSCEPVSQLVAAALHDAGLGDRAALRFWGAPTGGATHLTAVVDVPAPAAKRGAAPALVEWDLAAGRATERGGVRFAASELVEALARVAARAEGRGAAHPAPAAAAGALPTLTGGFPANDDAYAGGLPLFAQRAVRGVAPAGEPGDPPPSPDYVLGCANQAPLVLLDPPRVDVDRRDDPYSVTLYRATGKPETVERLSDALFLVEHHFDGQPLSVLERAILAGCRVALNDRVAVELAQSGDVEGALRASAGAQRARAEGGALVSELWKKPPPPKDAGALTAREWPLLFLAGGADVLEARIRAKGVKDWGQVLSLAALVLAPESRERGAALAVRLPPRDRVDVMHEVFFAHGSTRPWTSNVPLDAPAGSDGEAAVFFSSYRAFRKMALRLWEGGVDKGPAELPVEDTLADLVRDARAAGAPRDLEVALVRYYVRHALGIYQFREGGFGLAPRLDAWLRANGFEDDELVTRRLPVILRAKRLDAQTYADAWRSLER